MRPVPGWRCSWRWQSKNSRQKARASSMEAKREGKAGRYLSVLKCASKVGVVGRGVGAVVRARHAEVGEQIGHRPRGHRAAAIGVHGEGVPGDLLLGGRLADEVLGDLS